MTPVGSKAIVLNESSGVPSLKPLSKLVHLCSEVVLTFFVCESTPISPNVR